METGVRLQLGNAQPYQAAGGFMKATRLLQPSGAAVRSSITWCSKSPRAGSTARTCWRSKLPLVCQDGVAQVSPPHGCPGADRQRTLTHKSPQIFNSSATPTAPNALE